LTSLSAACKARPETIGRKNKIIAWLGALKGLARKRGAKIGSARSPAELPKSPSFFESFVAGLFAGGVETEVHQHHETVEGNKQASVSVL
jgi:hypothetical protein